MSTAVQKAAPLAKEALKEGISNAANFGSEKAIQGIQKLAEKSINYGAPESLTHSLAKAAEQGTKAAVKESTKALNSSLAHIVPTSATPKPRPRASTSATPTPKPRPVPKVRKRPGKQVHHPKAKKRKEESITNLIDQI